MNKSINVFLGNEPVRCQKILPWKIKLKPQLCFILLGMSRPKREMIVINNIITTENSVTGHAEFPHILRMKSSADKAGSIIAHHSFFDPLFPTTPYLVLFCRIRHCDCGNMQFATKC